MPPNILLEERQLRFFIRASVPDSQAVQMRRALKSRRFLSALLKAFKSTLRRFPSLEKLRVQVQ